MAVQAAGRTSARNAAARRDGNRIGRTSFGSAGSGPAASACNGLLPLAIPASSRRRGPAEQGPSPPAVISDRDVVRHDVRALVRAFLDLLDDLRGEGIEIAGVAARHDAVGDDDLAVDPVRAGILHV